MHESVTANKLDLFVPCSHPPLGLQERCRLVTSSISPSSVADSAEKTTMFS